jgi:polysaccharide export outer membrane protein
MTKKLGGAGVVALIILLFLTVFQPGETVLAAESTSDVVVDSAQKEKLRQDIVGNLQLPGEQQEYVIGYSDILSITLYGEGDMAASQAGADGRTDAAVGTGGGGDTIRRAAGGVEVRMDGRVSLKHIGDIKVVGMTLTQLADYLKKLYVSVFDDPIVTVTLLQSNSRRYTVMGQVNAPGIFYLDFPVTIVQSIARSGGFTEWANHDDSVNRQGSGPVSSKSEEKKSIEFDYDDFLKGKHLEKNVYIQPNDVVIVR